LGLQRTLALHVALIAAVAAAAAVVLLWLPSIASLVAYSEDLGSGFRGASIHLSRLSARVAPGGDARVAVAGRGWGCRASASVEDGWLRVDAAGSVAPLCWDCGANITIPPGLDEVDLAASMAGVSVENITAGTLRLSITAGGLEAGVAAGNLTVRVKSGSAEVRLTPLGPAPRVDLTVSGGSVSLWIYGNATVRADVAGGHATSQGCGGGPVQVDVHVAGGSASVYCLAPRS